MGDSLLWVVVGMMITQPLPPPLEWARWTWVLIGVLKFVSTGLTTWDRYRDWRATRG